MARYFISFFIIGAMFTRIFEVHLDVGFAWLLGACIAIGFWRRSSFLLAAFGLLWGLSNVAPFAKSGEIVAVHKKTWQLGTEKFVFVKSGKSIFQTYGQARIGERGRVRCFAEPIQPLLQQPCYLRSNSKLLRSGNFDLRNQRLARWLDATVLGIKPGFFELRFFRESGLLHLLVVSGLHVGVFGGAFLYLVLLPLRILSTLLLIKPTTFIHLYPCAHLLALAAVLVYGLSVGFSVATQRAVLLFAGYTLAKVFGWRLESTVGVICASQILLFPASFVSAANLMSWSAYLAIYVFLARASGFGFLLRLYLCQAVLSAFVGSLFGNFSLIGFFINPVVVPLFSLLFSAQFLLLSIGKFDVEVESWLSLIHDVFLLTIHNLEFVLIGVFETMGISGFYELSLGWILLLTLISSLVFQYLIRKVEEDGGNTR